MAKEKTIALSQPHATPKGAITKVILREPTFGMLQRYGDIRTFAQRGGTGFFITNDEAVSNYLRSCLVEPQDLSFLEGVCLQDALTIRDTLISFFMVADAPITNP